ncbi:MAG: hypothetical protein A2Y15_01035 [Clostridiales bacterium GWF2_36_10]|nr:MAG: hypothetical protein A2Y15_01035 [Clostridiales bacterium GWF2_36_10]HAN20556.1 hypothetical protein [Clostridiales bacterium]
MIESTVKKEENPHLFHRQRLKERFLKQGAQSFDDKTLLELLLSFALPRVDTRPLAASLLDRFGSLSNVLSASVSELTKMEGIKQHTAILITMLPEISRRFITCETEYCLNFLDEVNTVKYFKGCFAGFKEERVMLFCLDSFGGLLEKKELHRGSINSASFSMRLITEAAINNSCSNVILAHNHPNGSAMPSNEDIYTTQRIAAALLINDINLVEHYIVAGDRCTPIMKNMPERYGNRG